MQVPGNVVLVSGTHDTGKTTIIEALLRRLEGRYDVAVVKDIHIDGFSIDSPGKDTCRHADAGAAVVCARGPAETSFITRSGWDLDRIVATLEPRVDLIIAEGFKDRHGTKILAARDQADLADIKATCTDEDDVLAVGGIIVSSKDIDPACSECIILRDDAAFDRLVEKIEPKAKLGRLHRNRLRMPLEELGCTLEVDGTPVAMKPYVAESLRNVVVGTVAALHWNLHEPVATIEATFDKRGAADGTPLASTLAVRVNDKVLTMKAFVRDSIGEAVLGYAGTLSLPGHAPLASAGMVRVLVGPPPAP